tara:strand:- start:2654 stop:3253 length:600 start_codon:yes stop_codon:yes gene_type:complete
MVFTTFSAMSKNAFYYNKSKIKVEMGDIVRRYEKLHYLGGWLPFEGEVNFVHNFSKESNPHENEYGVHVKWFDTDMTTWISGDPGEDIEFVSRKKIEVKKKKPELDFLKKPVEIRYGGKMEKVVSGDRVTVKRSLFLNMLGAKPIHGKVTMLSDPSKSKKSGDIGFYVRLQDGKEVFFKNRDPDVHLLKRAATPDLKDT